MSFPKANDAWFRFFVSGRPDFAVYAFSGVERISRPYSFSIDLVSLFEREPLADLVGKEACLSIADRSGASRLVHGVILEMEQLHTANLRTLYRCRLAPRLWFLGLRRNHRIFQNKTVPEIITSILEEQKFTREAFAFKCRETYPPREYCVQYGESDLHFISRLCEEEGIYYYFEHALDRHCLCFSDAQGGPGIGGQSRIRHVPGSGQTPDTAVVSRATLRARSVSDQATLRDWSFLAPSTVLEGSELEPDASKAPIAPGVRAETYAYPHIFQTAAEAQRYTGIQLLRQLTFQTWLEAESDVSRFLPGFTFTLYGHESARCNGVWWITGVTHRGEQPQVLEHEAPDRGMSYAATLLAIPEKARYVPELAHPAQRIQGTQTAVVTGPDNEEVYPDEYGRVKVQFFWDRAGKWDEKTSCWVRVAQGWAGTEFGGMAVPRIGHEVVVSFLEGNPDRPLITGLVHNAASIPPYALPAHKTRTIFRSMSTPGGKGRHGFNELSIEDKSGAEAVVVHAEKDVNIHVKKDWKEHILHDRHQVTDRHTSVETHGETHELLRGQRKTELDSDDHLTVRADSHTRVDTQWLLKAGKEIHIASGERMVLEAGSELTVKTDDSWLKLDASGVRIQGPAIRLGGGGSAAEGTPAKPLLPQSGEGPDVPAPPEFVPPPRDCLCRAAQDKNPCVAFSQ